MNGIELITEERIKQIEKHDRTLDYDKSQNDNYQLSEAAIGLCWVVEEEKPQAEPVGWNPDLFDKMINKPYKERLIIAGALIAAEIDRLS